MSTQGRTSGLATCQNPSASPKMTCQHAIAGLAKPAAKVWDCPPYLQECVVHPNTLSQACNFGFYLLPVEKVNTLHMTCLLSVLSAIEVVSLPAE